MTDITTKEYVERLLEAKLETIQAKIDAQERALIVASEELQRRFHQINNLQQQVTEAHKESLADRERFVTREVYTLDKEKRRESDWGHWTWLLGWLVAVAVAAISYFKKG